MTQDTSDHLQDGERLLEKKDRQLPAAAKGSEDRACGERLPV